MKNSNLRWSFSFSNEGAILSSFEKILKKVITKQNKRYFSKQFIQDLLTAFTEGVANAIRHAHELEKHGKIECTLCVDAQGVEMTIEDHGPGFNLTRVPLPKFRTYAESGRGVFMMRQLMDTVSYQRGSKKNKLILKRSFVNAGSGDVDLLYEISDAILQSPNPEHAYDIILEKMVGVFGVEKASILRYDPELKKLKVVASRGLKKNVKELTLIRPGEGISGYVFQHAKPCLIEDMEKNQSGWRKKKKYKSRSFISAPLVCFPMIRQETLGVINMTDRINGKPFTKKDLRLLTTIANQATAYLHICQFHSKAKKAEVLNRELEIARKIQQSYLPSKPPQVSGFELAGWCDMAQSVGGDYYDFLPAEDGSLYVVVADVSGHDVAAALTMANLRSNLKAHLTNNADPGVVLELLNKSLFDDLVRHDQFISIVLAKFSQNRDEVFIANAGHPYPFLLREGKSVSVFPNLASQSVLGTIQNEKYKMLPFKLSSGDTLVFFTDGILEMMGQKGSRLGRMGWTQLLENHASKSLASMIAALQEDLTSFRGPMAPHDDVTAAFVRLQ